MPNKTGRVTASSSKTERKGHANGSLLSVNDVSRTSEEKNTSATIDESSPKQPNEAEQKIALWIGKKVLDAADAARIYAIGKWKPILLSLFGATGISTAVFTMPLHEVRQMDGWVPTIKPARECKAPLTTTSSFKEIDAFLADPQNYGDLQKDVWEISVNFGGDFTGVQWLRERGNAPMRVTGYLAKGDWIDGAIRGVKGHGSYHLEARNNEETYRGTLTALDCALPQDMVIVCPYVLVPKGTRESEVGLAGRVCRRYVSSTDSASATP